MVLIQAPPEIWNEIFLRSLPPPNLLDASSCFSMGSHWCEATRQKKAIANVCRSWHENGLHLLYEDVCIFRPHQLPLLHSALKESRYPIQHRVKRLRISAMSYKAFSAAFQYHLRGVLELCPSLTSLDFSGCSALRLDWETTGQYPWIPSNITCLTLTDQLSVNDCHDLLGCVTDTLTHLNVHDFFPISCLTFTSLIDLTLHEVNHEYSCPDFLISRFYDFPAVQRITLVVPRGRLKMLSRCMSFCQEEADGVRMLQIQQPWGHNMVNGYLSRRNDDQTTGTVDLQPVLDQYPMLEHLVLHPEVKFPIKHPRVEWVDIWEPTITLTESESCLQHFWALKNSITKANFPNLKGVRTLGLLLQRLYPSIPVTFPPSMSHEPGFEPYEFKYTNNLHVRHEVGRIFNPQLELFYGSDENDSDGSYQPSESEEEEESSDDTDTDEADLEEEVVEDLKEDEVPENITEEDDEDIDPLDLESCDLLLERFGCQPAIKEDSTFYSPQFTSSLLGAT